MAVQSFSLFTGPTPGVQRRAPALFRRHPCAGEGRRVCRHSGACLLGCEPTLPLRLLGKMSACTLDGWRVCRTAAVCRDCHADIRCPLPLCCGSRRAACGLQHSAVSTEPAGCWIAQLKGCRAALPERPCVRGLCCLVPPACPEGPLPAAVLAATAQLPFACSGTRRTRSRWRRLRPWS